VDAVHVTASNHLVELRSRALAHAELLERNAQGGTIYDQAAQHRQHEGLELDFAGKLRILDHLEGFQPKIDISGGDALVVTENFTVMETAARRFGRDRITLTATGAGLARYDPATIAPLIGELNFTYDSVWSLNNENRPDGYARGNLRKAAQFARAGVLTRAECPLTTENIADSLLRDLYTKLNAEGIDKLLVMRLFPVGRGGFRQSSQPSPDQYRRAIETLRDMESRMKTPKLKLQCALKFFDSKNLTNNPCDLVKESFGLMADGTLLSSPWAVGPTGAPLHNVLVLGNLAATSLREILSSDKVREYERRQDENFGHCKIHAFLNSSRENAIDRLFDNADPLYLADTTLSAEDSDFERHPRRDAA